MSLGRRPAYQTKFKASDINVTAWVASGALKALPVLSDTTVRRSAVEQENLKPYKKSEKRPYILKRTTTLLFASFSKDFNGRKKSNRVILFKLGPIVLCDRYHRWVFTAISKTRFL